MSDYALGSTIYLFFTTRAFATGVPTTLSGSPALSVLEENNATPITAGVSVSVDRASVTGLNQATIVATSGNGFEAGKEYALYISAGTVGGTSVVGEVVGHFLIEKDSALRPTTAGRTLDVSATGGAGIDWSNVQAPTTVLNLSGTTIKTATDVEADTADIQTRLPAALVSGRMDSNVQATAASLTFNLTGSITGNLSGSVGSVTGSVGSVTGAVGSVTGNVGGSVASVVGNVGGSVASVVGAVGSVTGNVGGSVASVVGAVGSVTGNVGGNVVGSVGSVTGLTNATVADAVWDEALAGHLTPGSTGEALNSAGSAGDPWNTNLPGAYAPGTAGFILGTNLDALVSSIPTAVENADALLNRDFGSVSDTNSRTLLNAARFIRNEWDVAGVTLTVYKEDGVTVAWTGTVATDAAAIPIVGNNPA